ncbi:VOC family protein [Fimbriimonadia bacterium ATM]|nr:MAG: VOC family protein [Armatimonadota bacterium]MBC6968830.1 VOC family protein [Armatimonadota bacterium]MCE7899959.1 VOC family protein [Armatimonadetes bacterium ATM1]MDL1929248.1 VOC family protein [Fimbriimonadia bacterium ATM]RIJ96871.1 MAG: hypothetical protein DCC45_05795 [Armatimonadota bacterium]
MLKALNVAFCGTTDMEASVAFYRDVLGMSETMVTPYWSEFRCGDLRIGIHPSDGLVPLVDLGRGWTVCFETADLSALRQSVEEHGCAVLAEYHQTPSGVILTFADPQGNPLQAIQLGTKIEDFQRNP